MGQFSLATELDNERLDAAGVLKQFEGTGSSAELCDEEKRAALTALAFVLGMNYVKAEESEKDGKFTLAFKVVFDRNQSPTTVDAVSRCAKSWTQDVSITCHIDD